MYASVCVLRNKMMCVMKLNYGEEEVRNVNLTRSQPNASRGKAYVKTSVVGFG